MQIMLLGDMMGTKSSLLSGEYEVLRERYTIATQSFADCYRMYHRRSRSLFCLSFSDSLIAVWDDFNEGRRFCHVLARDLYHLLSQAGVPARIFVDKGDIVASIDNRFELYSALESRFIHFSPISFGAWSVFGGEEAHFAPGVYVGAELSNLVSVERGIQFSHFACLVGRFAYRKMTDEIS